MMTELFLRLNRHRSLFCRNVAKKKKSSSLLQATLFVYRKTNLSRIVFSISTWEKFFKTKYPKMTKKEFLFSQPCLDKISLFPVVESKFY